jgi:GxxExxY protein
MIKDRLTYTIIGCAMKVHNTLGPGFQEIIYQRCFAIELERAKLSFARESEQKVYYNDYIWKQPSIGPHNVNR